MVEYGISRGRVIKKKIIKDNGIRMLIAVTLIFIFLDFLVHAVNINIPYFPRVDTLPQGYFIGKLIAFPIILLILSNLFKLKEGTLLFLVTAILLQIRYLFYYIVPYANIGYDITTHIVMTLLHYAMIFISFQIIKFIRI